MFINGLERGFDMGRNTRMLQVEEPHVNRRKIIVVTLSVPRKVVFELICVKSSHQSIGVEVKFLPIAGSKGCIRLENR
jgi:hypothetical protein